MDQDELRRKVARLVEANPNIGRARVASELHVSAYSRKLRAALRAAKRAARTTARCEICARSFFRKALKQGVCLACRLERPRDRSN